MATEPIALLGLMALLAALPGTSVAFVVGRSIAGGRGAGFAATAGIVAGDLILLGTAILGLREVTTTVGGALAIGMMRYPGAAFLVGFGLSLWFSAKRPIQHCITPAAGLGHVASFLAGLLLSLGDLKALFFYASILPLFVDPGAMDLAGAAELAAITIVSVGGVKALYVVLAGKAEHMAPTACFAIARRVLAVVMVAMGGELAFGPW